MEDASFRKLFIGVLKILPSILAIFTVLYIILKVLGFNCLLLSFLTGPSLIYISILLACSFAFKFCFYHRIFIYYLYIVNMLNIVDNILLLTISSKGFIVVALILFIICAFVALYLHMKKHEIRIIKNGT